MRLLAHLTRILDAIAQLASMGFVLAVLGIMTAQVHFRYVLNSALQWSEELSIWMMIWMVFIGSVVVIRNWEHIYIPTFIRALPLKVRPFLIIFSKVAAGVFLATVLIIGIDVFNSAAHAFSHNIGVSTKWAKLSVPVGAGLMLLMVVVQVLEDLRRLLAADWEYFAQYGKAGGHSDAA